MHFVCQFMHFVTPDVDKCGFFYDYGIFIYFKKEIVMLKNLKIVSLCAALLAFGLTCRTASVRTVDADKIDPLLGQGIELAQQGNFSEANTEFFNYSKKNPDDVNGLILMAQCQESLHKYDLAIAYYARAAKIDRTDKRIEEGVSRAMLLKYNNEVAKAPAAGSGDLGTIKKTYASFMSDLERKQWKSLAASIDFPDALKGMGQVPGSDAEYMESVARYLGVLSSTTMKYYLKNMNIQKIVKKNSTARIYLASDDSSRKDSFFMKKDGGRWKVALFLTSMAPGGVNNEN